MAANKYHFVSRWRVEGTMQEVTDILGDAADLVRWWPSVYLDVQVVEPGEPNGLGKVVKLYTKGWLPYTLRWNFRVTEAGSDTYTLKAEGDFDGTGVWTFKPDGKFVDVIYDWTISAEKPILRYFSFIMKPLFEANHRWSMAQGEESLKLELLRRHATSEQERAQIPPPPPATPSSLLGFLRL